MPDPSTETTGLIAAITAALGGGGGLFRLFSTTNVHASEIKQLQGSRDTIIEKLDTTMILTGKLDERTERTGDEVTQILGLLRNKD